MMMMEIAETDRAQKDDQMASWLTELLNGQTEGSGRDPDGLNLPHCIYMWSIHISVWIFGSVLTADETICFHLATP